MRALRVPVLAPAIRRLEYRRIGASGAKVVLRRREWSKAAHEKGVFAGSAVQGTVVCRVSGARIAAQGTWVVPARMRVPGRGLEYSFECHVLRVTRASALGGDIVHTIYVAPLPAYQLW